MASDPRSLAERISADTGLEFSGAEGRGEGGSRWIELRPAGFPAGQTFTLRTVIGWRRIDVSFRLDNFAADLANAMGKADESGRKMFRSILGVCREAGSDVIVTVNGSAVDPQGDEMWFATWRSLELTIRRGMLAINEGDLNSDMRIIESWTARAAAAVVALLPVEVEAGGVDEQAPDVFGFPEGAKARVEVNRYERDRRNRAAALAIHGCVCRGCDVDMGSRYGNGAAGLIEVHHVTPVSQLGPGYIIDPNTDLVPLCPNCHAVVHRRTPPFSVEEIRRMLVPV